MKKRLLLIALTALTISLGFLRDALFIPLNDLIENGGDTGGRLVLLKWVLTLLFALIYLSITAGFLFLIFRSLPYVFISMGIYAAVGVISFLISFIGYVFFTFSDVYPFVRTLMGIAQSPVILIILIAACYFNEKLRVNK